MMTAAKEALASFGGCAAADCRDGAHQHGAEDLRGIGIEASLAEHAERRRRA